jgi:hypothetical protein
MQKVEVKSVDQTNLTLLLLDDPDLDDMTPGEDHSGDVVPTSTAPATPEAPTDKAPTE